MVSTRNTNRSNANPPRMQDPPGNTDSRPPGTIEATQANTNEVEALRVVNQRLIEDLEQLTRQIQHPRETRQTQEGHNIPPPPPPPVRNNMITTFPEVPKQKQSPAEPEGTDHNWPLRRRETRQCSEDMSGMKNYITLNRGQKSNHGSRGLGVFNKSSTV